MWVGWRRLSTESACVDEKRLGLCIGNSHEWTLSTHYSNGSIFESVLTWGARDIHVIPSDAILVVDAILTLYQSAPGVITPAVWLCYNRCYVVVGTVWCLHLIPELGQLGVGRDWRYRWRSLGITRLRCLTVYQGQLQYIWININHFFSITTRNVMTHLA